jgi:hypothetical protein
MNTQEKIEQILRDNNLLASEAENVFTAMGAILYEMAQATRRNEPYATESIRKYEEFSTMVDDYEYFIEQHEYNDFE